MTFFMSAVFMFQLNAGKYSEQFEQHLPILSDHSDPSCLRAVLTS